MTADPQRAFEIAAPSASPAIDDRTLVLGSGDTFAIFDRHGEMRSEPGSRHGLYAGGTRFLSTLWLQLAGSRPLLLSSGHLEDRAGLFVHETNPDVLDQPAFAVDRDQVHLVRRIRVDDGGCEVAITLRSYAAHRVRVPVRIGFAADYADVFEVRGSRRGKRGHALEPRVSPGSVELAYVGLDDVMRTTRLEFDPAPARVHAGWIDLVAALAPGSRTRVTLRVACRLGRDAPRSRPARYAVGAPARAKRDLAAAVISSSPELNAWIRRSATDLAMLTVPTAHGPLPYAGIPWFYTPFGRDALVAAYETLWIEPGFARGVLRFLAAHQADADDRANDAEPGKIVHEMRSGEMADLREVPFGRYYGSVDATPLFAMVAAAYYERTGDLSLLGELWPNLERALAWIDGPGDPDGDGFVEYQRRSPRGLTNHGWKDSHDSIMHADGSLAEGPIALCEVQAYVYAARTGLAQVARRLGHPARADALEASARRMRKAFAEAFWCEELATYALALDGSKRPCRVRSSNAGHVLLTGLAQPEHAEAIARTLLGEDHYSGWGIRTLATSAPRYNPMSYHDGSVWPHDNALIAAGLARHGDTHAAGLILGGLFDACRALEDSRLPELFCGFDRHRGEPPTLYPTACSPQAWAAGAVFLLLQSVLGLTIDGEAGAIAFVRPTLPPVCDRLSLRGLDVGGRAIDLELERRGDGIDARALGESTGVQVRVSR